MIIPSHSFGVVAAGRPRAAVATGFGAGDLLFDNITTNPVTEQYGNLVTATKSGTIYISVGPSVNGEHYGFLRKNGNTVSFTIILNGQSVPNFGQYGGEQVTLSINSGDTLQFSGVQSFAPVGSDSFTVTIRNENSVGTIIDTLTVSRV